MYKSSAGFTRHNFQFFIFTLQMRRYVVWPWQEPSKGAHRDHMFLTILFSIMLLPKRMYSQSWLVMYFICVINCLFTIYNVFWKCSSLCYNNFFATSFLEKERACPLEVCKIFITWFCLEYSSICYLAFSFSDILCSRMLIDSLLMKSLLVACVWEGQCFRLYLECLDFRPWLLLI